MKNHIKVREYSSYRLKFGLFLKLSKNYGVPLKNSELFCFKDKKNLAALFFVAAGNNIKKDQRANAQPYAYVANKSTRWLVEWTRRMNTGLTNTHTTRGFSVLYYQVFPRKQCILCSALRHKCCLTLLYVTSIRVFFLPLELPRTALLGLRLSASRLREDACLSNHISLGSIMLTCQWLLCINCFTSLVSFTGFYTAEYDQL